MNYHIEFGNAEKNDVHLKLDKVASLKLLSP